MGDLPTSNNGQNGNDAKTIVPKPEILDFELSEDRTDASSMHVGLHFDRFRLSPLSLSQSQKSIVHHHQASARCFLWLVGRRHVGIRRLAESLSRCRLSRSRLLVGNFQMSQRASTPPASGSGSGSGQPRVNMPAPSTTIRKRKPVASTASTAAAPSKRKLSAVWECFEICTDVERTAKCKFCGKCYTYHPKGTGTSNLHVHMKVCKEFAKVKIVDDPNQQILVRDEGGEGSVGSRQRFSQEDCRRVVVEMIILDELPFSHVENIGFKRLCNQLCPLFVVPSRRTVTRDALQMFLTEKARLKGILSDPGQRVCLTTDMWTSIQNSSYMVVTAHFVDRDWVLQRRIISFAAMTNHKGESIGKALESILQEWGINRVLTVTVDNASANGVALIYLKRKLRDLSADALPMADYDVMQVRCCCHILNLIVSDGLKELRNSITSVRNAVKYVRSSPARIQSFQRFVQLEQIDYKGSVILDVPTRWNSTYLMLETAVKFQSVFDRMAVEDGLYAAYFREMDDGKIREGPPLPEDWENARSFVSFLHTFYAVTNKFSASLTLTSNNCLAEICRVYSILVEGENSNDIVLANMARSMKVKFEKYWESTVKINKLLIVATILDPRCKMNLVGKCFTILFDRDASKMEEMNMACRDFLNKMYDEYNMWRGVPVGDGSAIGGSGAGASATGGGGSGSKKLASQSSGGSGTGTSSLGPVNIMRGFDAWAEMEAEEKAYDVSVGQSEVDRYLAEKTESVLDQSFDVLQWWKLNSKKFPILSQIARDVLAIPVSTVASESAFSTGGRVLDAFRSSLSPRMVEALVCTQNWLRCAHKSEASKAIETMIMASTEYDQVESEIIQGSSGH